MARPKKSDPITEYKRVGFTSSTFQQLLARSHLYNRDWQEVMRLAVEIGLEVLPDETDFEVIKRRLTGDGS